MAIPVLGGFIVQDDRHGAVPYYDATAALSLKTVRLARLTVEMA